MLRRFERIHGCGIFENFHWDSSKTPDFQRINLIYGNNGSGKTSLATALDDAKHTESGYSKLSVSIENTDNKTLHETGEKDDEAFHRTFVFSKGYVDRNQTFDTDSTVNAVLTLGEKTIEQQQRIDTLAPLIQESEATLSEIARTSKDLGKKLDASYTRLARSIVDALHRAGVTYSSNGHYSQRTVKDRFAGSHGSWKTISEEQKNAALSLVNSDRPDSIQPRSFSFKVRSGLPTEIAKALTATPATVLLDTLEAHPKAASWVDKGRQLHAGIDTCIFCGGPLTQSRKRQIDQHFSDAVTELQRRIDNLLSEIEDALNSVSQLAGDQSLSRLLYSDLRGKFTEAQVIVRDDVKECHSWLTSMREILRTKREDMLRAMDNEIPVPPAVDGETLESLIKQHNMRVSNHGQRVQESAQQLEYHFLKEAESDIQKQQKALSESRSDESSLSATTQTYKHELASLKGSDGDPLPSANDMTTELHRILGRKELEFQLLPNGKQYQVTRYGQPAKNLSTGERTAITLIHFLQTIRQADRSSGKPVVIVDDPISSLDREAAMGISTYIWGETVSKNYTEQVFLLTHSFELFREWDIQIDGLKGKRGATNSCGFTSSTYELVSKHRRMDGIIKRVALIVPWPPDNQSQVPKKIRSSYHHAFIEVASALQRLKTQHSMESELDALLLYPNVLRKILETFLAFKSPESVSDFAGSMRAMTTKLDVSGYSGDSAALRLQLTRFTHAHSHDDTPETDTTLPPEEILPTIQAVFNFMNILDHSHFQGLCIVSGFDCNELLDEEV